MNPSIESVEEPAFVRYSPASYPTDEMLTRSRAFYAWLDTRRTVREFSGRDVPIEVIEQIVRAAGTAPSGAHKQPWTFCVVADPVIKRQIREGAEAEERENYAGRMNDEWLNDLKPFGTDWQKPFLETAPYLIVVFRKPFDLLPDGTKRTNYYVNESVGIACGLLLAAIHHAGLAALTHTPSPMNFLATLLNRPANERPFLLIPVGYPAPEAQIPALTRKSLNDIAAWY
ncbi:nitroreductase family protein [Spirosoma arcticum]